MKPTTRVLLASIAALAVTVPAIAQEYNDPRGFRLKRPPRDFRDVFVSTAPEATMMRTAECIAEDRPGEIAVYLRSVPGSEAEDAAYSAFERKMTRCIPDMDMSSVGNATRARGKMTLRFDHSALRGALAESLMRENDMLLDPAKLSLGDDGMYFAERFHGGRSADTSRMFALGFAGCVLGHNSGVMQALFQTAPGGTEEKAAIIAMAPSFGQCVMEGQSLKLSAPTLRNQLAEVAYYALMAAQNVKVTE